MADWESELQDLLRTLDVSLEQDDLPSVHSVPSITARSFRVSALDGSLADESDPSDSMVRAFEQSGEHRAYEQTNEQDTAQSVELHAIRQEIEATIARVARLTRAGQLDRALRDDVVLVLRALTRPHPPAVNPQTQDDWNLASAAAILHFCRVVLRLTNQLEPED